MKFGRNVGQKPSNGLTSSPSLCPTVEMPSISASPSPARTRSPTLSVVLAVILLEADPSLAGPQDGDPPASVPSLITALQLRTSSWSPAVQPFPDNINDGHSHTQRSNKGPFKLNGPFLRIERWATRRPRQFGASGVRPIQDDH
jgi:hypothetical protein